MIEDRIGFEDRALVALPSQLVDHRMDAGMTGSAKGDEVVFSVVGRSGLLPKAVNVMNDIRGVLPTFLTSVFITRKNKFSGAADSGVVPRILRPLFDFLRVFCVVATNHCSTLLSLARVAKFLGSVQEDERTTAFGTALRGTYWNNASGEPEGFQTSDVVFPVRSRLTGDTVNLRRSGRLKLVSAAHAWFRTNADSGGSLFLHTARFAALCVSRLADKMRSTVDAVSFSVISHGSSLVQDISHYNTLRWRYV